MSSTRPTDELTLGEILGRQREAFLDEGIPAAKTRHDRILRLQSMLLDNADDIVDALREDFGSRPREVSLNADVIGCMGDMDYQRKHLATWMNASGQHKLAQKLGFAQRVRHDPKGVVGIIGPWNYPVYLTAVPAASAFAAGNRVMMRPSEITAHTRELLADLVPEYFALAELAVITHAHGEGADFSALGLDHLFFTGSPKVGSMVARAAGANLVPVTLELGGKNPAVVQQGADIGAAARRIAASRLSNSGQVCMCPDYSFVPEGRRDEFVAAVLDAWQHALPSLRANPGYTSIINRGNYDRILGLIDDAVAKGARKHEVIPPGESAPDPGTRKIPPTVLTGVTEDMAISGEEVFGPVLVVYGYANLAEPVAHINASPHPLTLYWYGEDDDEYARLQAATRSGSVNGNDFALNMLSNSLPFGGVGASGYGAYHGKAGFETFSHARAVTHSRLPLSVATMAAPPFGKRDERIGTLQLRLLRRKVAKARAKLGRSH